MVLLLATVRWYLMFIWGKKLNQIHCFIKKFVFRTEIQKFLLRNRDCKTRTTNSFLLFRKKKSFRWFSSKLFWRKFNEWNEIDKHNEIIAIMFIKFVKRWNVKVQFAKQKKKTKTKTYFELMKWISIIIKMWRKFPICFDERFVSFYVPS